MRAIDADALLKSAGIFEAEACARGCWKSILHLAKTWLFNEVEKAPTIDAVPVVRCKDCKHFEKWGKECGYCHFWDYEQGMSPNRVVIDDFCSYGERKDGDGDAN